MKAFVIRYVMMAVIFGAIIAMTACSFQVGVEWTGETKKDNRSYSDKVK